MIFYLDQIKFDTCTQWKVLSGDERVDNVCIEEQIKGLSRSNILHI